MSVCGSSTSCSSSSGSSGCKPIQKLRKKQDYTERSIYKLIRPTSSGLLLTDTKVGGNLTLTGNFNVGSETISNTELGYLSGLSSNVQLQINNLGTGSTSGNLNGLSDALVENNSIYLGSDPSGTTDTAEGNVAVGIEALDSITTGDNNVAVGYNALTENTTGYKNTALGFYSLANNTTGWSNIGVGELSLYENTTGKQNIAIGTQCLRFNNTGSENTAIGLYSMYRNIDGFNNTATGWDSLNNNVDGSNNSAFGVRSLYDNTSGCFNIGLGQFAGKSLATGNYNVMIGYETQPSSSNAENQIVIGKSATGVANNSVTLGNADVSAVYMAEDSGATVYCAGLNIGGVSITASGAEINYLDGVTSNIQTQINSISINDLTDSLIESNSIYLGSDPNGTTDTAEGNVAVGIEALDSITTGDNNVAVGYQALTSNTTGIRNTASGSGSLKANTTGKSNTATGSFSLYNNTTGGNNTAIGQSSLYENTTGMFNTASGYESLNKNTTGNQNTASGYLSLYLNTTGSNNTASGFYSLYSNTTGSNNTALGYQAGDVITTGSNNVILGYQADPSGLEAENQIVIGKDATGVANNSVTLGNADVTAVYMAEDSGATVYCAGLNLGSSIVFEGSSSNDFETTLTVTDATTDRTITFPDASGKVFVTTDASINDLNDALLNNNSIYLGNPPPNGSLSVTEGFIELAGAYQNFNYFKPSTYGPYEDLVTTTNGNGTGAKVTLTHHPNVNSPNYIYLGSVKITDGGTGYAAGDTITIDVGSQINNGNFVGIDLTVQASGLTSSTGYVSLDILRGEWNVGVGIEALYSITYGNSNVAIGYQSLNNDTSGNNNTALGYEAGDVITTGSNNVIIGYQADPSGLEAENQIVIGQGATGVANNSVTLGNADVSAVYMAQDSGATVYCAGLNIGGVSITASGAEINYLDGVTSNIQTQINSISINDLTDALIESNSIYLGSDPNGTTDTAEGNVAVGIEALDSITTGDNNVAAGYQALTSNTTGNYNTALGYQAGDLITTGTNNVIIGCHSDPNANNAINQIVIGHQATGVANNSVTLGNADVSAVYMAQDSGATVYCAGLNIGGVSITASGAEINYLDGVTSNIQTQIDSISGGASGINDLTDALIESNSIYLGSDPNATTSNANYNVAVGINALDSITSGDNNVAVGYQALTDNTSGASNTALGGNSLKVNTTGNSNTALGLNSLYTNTEGSSNTAVGTSSLYINSTGDYNTALGFQSLLSNSTGESNVAVGYQAGKSITTGTNNVAVGYQAGDGITSGNNNVIIGYGADTAINAPSNQIVIGQGVTGIANNFAVIGNSDITRLYAAQDGAAVLYADATINSSDRRLKKDISDTTLGLSFINELNPVSYKWINEKRRGSETHFGLIAQEVEEVMNKRNMSKEDHAVVQYDEKEDKYGMSYNELICPLIKSVQELTAENNQLKSQLASVMSRLDALENK